ncbi:MAG: proprotein convertase P-domain-containing protein, partial [Pseudomonadota bacterium]
MSLAQTFPGAGTGAIPDGAGAGPANYGPPLDVTFAVSGLTGSLTDVSLSITATHTWLGDLDVVLAPPGVTPGNPGSFVIFSRVGATFAGAAGDSSNLGATYIFNDGAVGNFWTAAAGVGGGTTVPAGSYRTSVAGPTTAPAANTSLLTAFGGLTPAQINGTWTLRFRDGWNADPGTVTAAALTLSDVTVSPTVTSANATTFNELVPGTFNVTATGTLPITFSLTGTLPLGVSFNAATGQLSGTPVSGSAGVYPLVITASNGTPPDDTQNFTLTVDPAPGGTLLSEGTIHTFEDTNVLAIPNNGCPTEVTRTFTVSDAFNVGGFGTIAIGVEIDHPDRAELILTLEAPDGSTQVLQSLSGGALANINATYSANADPGTVVNDGDADPLTVAGGVINYRRLIAVPGLDTFYSGTSAGNWTLRLCDDAGGGDTGSLQRAELVLIDTSAPPLPQVCTATSSFDWGGNGNNVAFTSANVVPDNVTLTQLSTSGEPPGDVSTSYLTSTGTLGAHPGYYALSMDADTNGVAGDDTELIAESATFSFSTPVTQLSFSLLDVDKGGGTTSWEDYVRVRATGPQGQVKVHQTVDNTANLAFAGAWIETDLAAGAGTTDGNINYVFGGAVSEVQIQYAQGNEPNDDSVFQIIGISDLAFCAYDYGDAPLSFCDGVLADCPRHSLSDRERLFMGTLPADGESAPQISTGSDGDDNSLNSDESTSITYPGPRLPGQGWVCGSYTTDPDVNEYCLTVTVNNQTGSPAQLVGWVDFDVNGTFEPDERSLPEL